MAGILALAMQFGASADEAIQVWERIQNLVSASSPEALINWIEITLDEVRDD